MEKRNNTDFNNFLIIFAQPCSTNWNDATKTQKNKMLIKVTTYYLQFMKNTLKEITGKTKNVIWITSGITKSSK